MTFPLGVSKVLDHTGWKRNIVSAGLSLEPLKLLTWDGQEESFKSQECRAQTPGQERWPSLEAGETFPSRGGHKLLCEAASGAGATAQEPGLP